MKKLAAGLGSLVAVVAGVMVFTVSSTAPASAGAWQWIDATEECVSCCDWQEYQCPCWRADRSCDEEPE